MAAKTVCVCTHEFCYFACATEKEFSVSQTFFRLFGSRRNILRQMHRQNVELFREQRTKSVDIIDSDKPSDVHQGTADLEQRHNSMPFGNPADLANAR